MVCHTQTIGFDLSDGRKNHGHDILTSRNSHSRPLRRELWQAHRPKGQRTKAFHEWQVEGQGQRHEGYQVGAYPQEGTTFSEALEK